MENSPRFGGSSSSAGRGFVLPVIFILNNLSIIYELNIRINKLTNQLIL